MECSKEGEMSRWTLTVVMAIGLTGTARTASAQSGDPFTVLVHVTNHAEIPQGVLTQALAEASRIYGGIGVKLGWSESAATYHFMIRITSKPFTGSGVMDHHTLGATPGTKQARGTLAYAFYNSIERLAWGSGTDVGVILGHVIAHELGHLLLPHDSHTMLGVMGSRWDGAQVNGAKTGELTFTRDQAKAIRQRLQNGR
jgi:hypothetical protein